MCTDVVLKVKYFGPNCPVTSTPYSIHNVCYDNTLGHGNDLYE